MICERYKDTAASGFVVTATTEFSLLYVRSMYIYRADVYPTELIRTVVLKIYSTVRTVLSGSAVKNEKPENRK